ncbi:MAG TPA: VOC family protein [Kiloniellaceae bacterium]|nr:VOC family protein [Kiloniellaceae bacterium]
MTESARTQGAHHIGLTVADLTETRRFFVDTLGFSQVGERPEYPAVFVSDGHIMITLWQAADPATAVAFDRRKVIGLHHLALKVADSAALESLHQRLRGSNGVEIEFAPEALGQAPFCHMMCYIPGGIRVEFIAPTG